jgi:two-component system chemotaxis response regulator CheB
MPGRDIIVIGGSAGSIEPIVQLLSQLPSDLPATLFAVIHIPSEGTGILPQILQRRSTLDVLHPSDGQPIRAGQVYVAPPDHHLLVKRGKVRVTRGPKENRFRPAIDPLFRSAAAAYQQRVVGVLLSGALDDGTFGLMLVKKQGGLAIVQHPEEALMPSMPLSAIQNVEVDHILRVEQIAPLLMELARTPLPQGTAMAKENVEKPDVAEAGAESLRHHSLSAAPSGFTCPECGGALWELTEGSLLRYRCHVGHGFSAESLLAEKGEQLEIALWTALRALEENAALQRRLAERTRGRGLHAISESYESKAEHIEARADIVRSVLINDKPAKNSQGDGGASAHKTASQADS